MAFWQDSNRLLIDGELVPASRGGTFPSISRENGTPGLEELLQTTLLARPAAS